MRPSMPLASTPARPAAAQTLAAGGGSLDALRGAAARDPRRQRPVNLPGRRSMNARRPSCAIVWWSWWTS